VTAPERCAAEVPRLEQEAGPSSAEFEPTFRDPGGQLYLTENEALRRIRPQAAAEALQFLASPLRENLERTGDLIATEIADAPLDASPVPGAAPGELWLRHPRIDPITYPWEWTQAQWRAAAELTLRLAARAIDAGWTLKDATPLNVVFSGTRPVFVDVLSFERRDPHSSVWLAYGQFVRTFLLPLVAHRHLGWSLQATLFVRDGYEPGELYRALPKWRRLTPGLMDVVTLAALLEGKSDSDKSGKPRKAEKPRSSTDPELTAHILHKRFARLGKQIRHAAAGDGKSQWSRYEQTATHYQPADTDSKQEFVRGVLERLKPARVLDIGANTGTYSLLAASAGAKVVALDSDTAAVASLWRTAAEQRKPITALVANIARPTPAAGWRNREHLSLLDRLWGKSDLVLMLAVIHHLILREQLPLGHIAGLSAGLTRRWLVLEWVPPSDPMFQEWLRGRDDLYGHLSEDDLNRAFAPFFQFVERRELGNGRVLLLLERNSPGAAQPGAAPA
jgi:SAM-dependent methyltransferase